MARGSKAFDHSKYKLWIDPNELVPYEKNAKIHTDKQIKNIVNSINRFGWQQDVVITTDNVLVIGHGRRLAAIQIGCEVPYHVIDKTADELTDKDIRELRIADNKTNSETGYDFDLMNVEIEDLDFEGFDFDFDEIGGVATDTSTTTEDDYEPELPEAPKAKLGDIYQLGKHRLMCGSSTNEDDVNKLMNGETADIAFTSPPYNAGTTATETHMGKTTKYDGNDDDKTDEEYTQFISEYLNLAIRTSEYVFMNIQSLSNNKVALIDVLYKYRDLYADTLIWDKGNAQPAMAENVMNSVFEYIHVFSRKANRAIGTIPFRGTIDNILHLSPQRNNEYSDIHNATFSVEFAAWFISRFAKETVLDSFGGTGTTLIACEQLNRRCFMMELEPKYIDVIIDRWEKLTGEKAVLLNG